MSRISPPPDIEDKLAAQWRFVLQQTDTAMKEHSRDSVAYGTAMTVSLTFVTAVMICYGFPSLRETNEYLKGLINK